MGGTFTENLLRHPFLNYLNVRRKFTVEFGLIKGNSAAKTSQSSVLHFSVNKAASQYTKSVLCRCAAENGLVHANFSDLAFNSTFPYFNDLSADEMHRYNHVFKPQGYIYSVFGGQVDGIRSMDDYRVVLTIRDPRDVLVSKYFSTAFGHKEPRGRDKLITFRERRQEAQALGVDDFVITALDRVLPVYQDYADLITRHRHVHVAHYEDMIADFSYWLDGILSFCRFRISEDLREALFREAERSEMRTEDINRHLRQRKPGDHQRKLWPATVAHLNRELEPVLRVFGYQ